MARGELYDEHGKLIGAVADAGSAGNGSGGNGHARPGPRTLSSGRPDIRHALAQVPTWGWVAIAGLVAAGAYAAFGDEGGAFIDDDEDGVDDDEAEAA
jgi:hypothetical protein